MKRVVVFYNKLSNTYFTVALAEKILSYKLIKDTDYHSCDENEAEIIRRRIEYELKIQRFETYGEIIIFNEEEFKDFRSFHEIIR